MARKGKMSTIRYKANKRHKFDIYGNTTDDYKPKRKRNKSCYATKQAAQPKRYKRNGVEINPKS